MNLMLMIADLPQYDFDKKSMKVGKELETVEDFKNFLL